MDISLKISLSSMLTMNKGGGGVPNQFSAAKKVLEDGTGDVVFLIVGDSTGNAADEWVYLFAGYLADTYPTHSVNYALWDDANSVYPTPTVIQTGSGSRTIHFWNASVAGTSTTYMIGQRYDVAIGAIDPDVILWNHGHNVSGVEALKRGKFYAAIETVKQRKPAATTLIVKQNPNRDSNANDLSAALAEEIGTAYGDTVIDFYDTFIANGKPPSWYADAIHPSALANETVMLPIVAGVWERAKSADVAPNGSFISRGGVNLLNIDAAGVDQGYGWFSGYVSGTPTGWTANGTPTISREETIVDSEMGDVFSVQVDATALLDAISRTISAPSLAAIKADGFSTLAVRKYVPAEGGANAGRIESRQAGTGGANQTGIPIEEYQRGYWIWDIIAGQSVADTITSATARLYGDTGSDASTAYFGRAILVAGKAPGGDSTAPAP